LAESSYPIKVLGFNERKTKYTSKDIRFNRKGDILYATTMGVPMGNACLKAHGKKNTKI